MDDNQQGQFAGWMPPPPPPPPGAGMPPPPPPPPGMGDQGGQPLVAQPVTEEEAPIVPIGSFGIEGEFKTNIVLPKHELNFNENRFLQLLAWSISLSKAEKKKIIMSIPKLSQYQIDELMKIFEEEKAKFSSLDQKHKEQLRALEAKHSSDWESLEMEVMQEWEAEEEEAAADDIRKSLGI